MCFVTLGYGFAHTHADGQERGLDGCGEGRSGGRSELGVGGALCCCGGALLVESLFVAV